MPRLRVEVCYALAERQTLVPLDLPMGATAGEALSASGVQTGNGTPAIAIFGHPVAAATPLKDGDRVDVLRPLAADPKETRRIRARRAKR